MRNLDNGFVQKLASGATTLCLAWVFERKDGLLLRITSHDRDLIIGSETYTSAPTFGAGQLEANSTLSPDSFSALAAYDIEGIRAEDIILGRWDRAKVKLSIIDWQNTNYSVEIWNGYIDSFRQRKFGFEMDLVGPEKGLSNMIGRKFTKQCSAKLGDRFCKIDFTIQGRTINSSVNEIINDRSILLSGINISPMDFVNGRLLFTNGGLDGCEYGISNIEEADAGYIVFFDYPMPILPSVNDGVRLFVGCDKTFATCKSRFSNQANFRGFPHMPGEDFVFSAAK